MAIFEYTDMDNDRLEVSEPNPTTQPRYTRDLFVGTFHEGSDGQEIGGMVALDWAAACSLRDALNNWLGEES